MPFRNLQARGAFGDDTIYLSQEFLAQNLDNPRQVADVIFEEMGHYLDSRLSREDSPGDEGAIFASLVQNQHLGIAELHSLKQEDDHATLNVERQVISVELADWDPSSIPFPETREAWEWPFSAESIWNLPLGNNAVYEPANLKTGKATKADVELLYQVSENDPLTRLYAPGSWTNRCSGTNSPTGNPADEIYIRFPEDEIVGDANPPHTPNNTTSILQPDGETIRSVSPLARCEAGGPVYGWYYGEENIYGMGITGSHGGSKLSGLGGSIRLGELTNNDPIRHALKINVFANKYLHYDQSDPTPGYRWPASRADGYAAGRYGGSNEDFEMGSLLAIPQNVTPESLGIESLPALKLFYALQDYGAYVVDDTAWDVTAFNLQKGVKDEFEQTYGYQFGTNDANSQWFQEYYALVESLHLVTNNSSSTIGGGGSRVAPLAPPFASDPNHAGESDNSTDSIRVENDSVVGNVVAAINAGGPFLTQNGIDFAADDFFLNGDNYEDNGFSNGLQSVFDGTIYETERYAATLNYEIPVDSSGRYTVELYFTELYWSDSGKRIFDIVVEGETVFDDLDILAETGGDINQPFIFKVPSTVSPDTFGASDAIDISFDASTDNGKVSGIVIRSADNTPSQTTSPVRVEAETMNLNSYDVQTNSSASGGELISLYGDAGLETGTASFSFQGVSGNYDVVIGYYDENDGEAQINVQQNDTILDSWKLNQQLGSNVADSQTFTTKTIATNLSVNTGDVFTLTGIETEYEHARIDYLELIPLFDEKSAN
ncbi:MAG: hypothetical protein GVY17_03995 [Cyanobacteria bacterium]|nr:hypothetical protein [Cyanobacteria bacterium GSL.Bin21]